MGNLGADPDLRYLNDGCEVVTVSIACTEKWKDKAGQVQESTEWVRAVCFGKRAKAIADYFKKGSQIHVTTKSRTRKYEKNGIDHWTTEYVISDFQFCGQRTGDSSAKASQQAAAYNRTSEQPPASAYEGQAASYDDFNDDIPF